MKHLVKHHTVRETTLLEFRLAELGLSADHIRFFTRIGLYHELEELSDSDLLASKVEQLLELYMIEAGTAL